jgi:hypothetical protein
LRLAPLFSASRARHSHGRTAITCRVPHCDALLRASESRVACGTSENHVIDVSEPLLDRDVLIAFAAVTVLLSFAILAALAFNA